MNSETARIITQAKRRGYQCYARMPMDMGDHYIGHFATRAAAQEAGKRWIKERMDAEIVVMRFFAMPLRVSA